MHLGDAFLVTAAGGPLNSWSEEGTGAIEKTFRKECSNQEAHHSVLGRDLLNFYMCVFLQLGSSCWSIAFGAVDEVAIRFWM